MIHSFILFIFKIITMITMNQKFISERLKYLLKHIQNYNYENYENYESYVQFYTFHILNYNYDNY